MTTKLQKRHFRFAEEYFKDNPLKFINTEEELVKFNFEETVNLLNISLSELTPARGFINTFLSQLREKYHLGFYDAGNIKNAILSRSLSPQLSITEDQYRKVIQDYWKSASYKRTDDDLNEEFRLYLENRFGPAIDAFFRKYYNNHQITINFALWSFQEKKTLPVNRKYINMDNAEYEASLRDTSFTSLRKSQSYYSTISEIVGNNIQSAFHFDQTKALDGIMTIKEVNLTSKKVIETKVNGSHRFDMPPEKIFSFEKIEDYFFYRENDEQSTKERAYQNEVIRWYIRSGIFNPKEAKFRAKGATTGDLLTKSEGRDEKLIKKLNKIVGSQYNSIQKKENQYTKEENETLDEVIDYIFKYYPEHIAGRVFVFDTGFLDLTQQENSITHVYWAPIITGMKGQETGGVFYINTDKALHQLEKEKIDQSLWDTLSNITRFLSGVVDDSQIEEITYIHDLETVTAAAVSVMSRNISHNIGSHTMSYEKNDLSSEKLMLANNALEDLVKKEVSKNGELEYYLNPDFLIEKNGKFYLDLRNTNFKLKYLRAKGAFDAYLKERQDYIGSIAASGQSYFGSLSFKDDVIEYFLGGEEIEEGEPSIAKKRNILLERIVRSEDFNKEDIEINYIEEGLKNVEISLPAGTTGRQGIFAILENVIRNSAKHGDEKKVREKIKLTITVSPYEFKDEQGKKIIDSDYYLINLTENSGIRAKEKLQTIRESLYSPLIKEGKVDEKHKGIKEMQIAAGWMRGIVPRDLEEEQKKDTHKVLEVNYSERQKGLNYQFLVRKAKKVLIIDNQIYTALPEGWDSTLADSYKEEISTKSYRFTLYNQTIQDLDLEGISGRVMGYDVKKLFKQLKVHTAQQLESQIYAFWLNRAQESPFVNLKNEGQKIAINDRGRYQKSESPNILTEIDPDKSKEATIIFRHHNDSSSHFKAFEKEYPQLYKQAVFIEGISGGNSTERLCREEQHNEFWYHKMRESALTKIMIIDERIWKEITAPYAEKPDQDVIFHADTIFEQQKYSKKNIHIYTIEKRGDAEHPWFLINLANEVEARMQEDGVLVWEEKFEPKSDFHFMSFHQGLLDKVERQETHFFKNFLISVNPKLSSFVHSGRSFTPDLPKNTGFIPLSSLDIALRDCKFSLTDLFFSSTFFKEM